MIEIVDALMVAGSVIVGWVIAVSRRYTKAEIRGIAMSIHEACQEASDEGSDISDVEALDIIDDIIVAYLE